MMRARLFRTTAFRLSLVHALVYSLISACALGFIHWTTVKELEAQIDSRLRLETDVLLNLYRTSALPALLQTIEQRNRDEGGGTRLYLLSGPNQGLLAGPVAGWPQRLEAVRTYATLPIKEVLPNRPAQHGANEMLRVLVTDMPDGYRMLVGRGIEDELELESVSFNLVVVAALITFSMAVFSGVLMGYSVLRRVDRVNRTAGEIMSGDFSQRIDIGNARDEFSELGDKLNNMFTRIEQLMRSMREVTDHVAHDLRSPLNRLRNRLDVALLESRDVGDYRNALQSAIADADNLITTFNSLLSIAQAEAGTSAAQWVSADLDQLTQDLYELYEPAALEKELHLKLVTEPELIASCQRTLVAQSLGNLIDNAIKYTPRGGCIEISAVRLGDMIEISVADNGPGIPVTAYEKVQQRFARLDAARSEPGNGLGLSLVKAVAQLHRGALHLADNAPGLRVSILIPRLGKRELATQTKPADR